MSQRSTLDRDTGEVRTLSTKTYDKICVLGRDVGLEAGDREGGHFTFEVSVPKVLRRTNEIAASCQGVREVVERIYHASSLMVDHVGDWTDLELLRLDLVRGFDDVRDISTTLGRLGAVAGSGGRLRKVFTDPKRGHAQTLTVGTPRRWMATAYDKSTEMSWAATRVTDPEHANDLRQKAHDLRARGHLRVEISVRGRPLRERLGTNRLVEVLREDTMNVIAEHYFATARFDASVGGTTKVIEALRRMDEHPEDKRVADRVIAALYREANNLPAGASLHSLEKYQKVARRYHLSAADFHAPDQPAVRLDWDRGLQVTEAAA